MSHHIPPLGEEALPFPDFHDEVDLFADDQEPSALHPRRRRALIIISIVLPCLLLLGTVLIVMMKRQHIIYQAQHVTQGDLTLTVNATGPLHTNTYTVNFMGGGKLAEITVKVGQQVKKDQILARLDTTSLQNALNESEANLAAAQTAFNNAKANYDATLFATTTNVNVAQTALDNATYSLTQVQIKSNATTLNAAQARVDTAKQQLANAKVQQTVQNAKAEDLVNTSQAALNSAQVQVATAKYNLSNAVLKAPHNGTIASIDGMVGGMPGATFVQIVDLSLIQVQANVDESHINSVAVGDLVKFSLNAYSDRSLEGKVAAISPLGQSSATATTYPVLIDIAPGMPDTLHLFPGMSARASITTTDRSNALLVPASAIRFARASVEPRAETDHRSLISHAQVDEALARANDMLQNLQQDVANDQLAPAFVLERDDQGKIFIKPIVIGLTDGNVYEVLDGLSTDDGVLVGARTGSN